MVRIEFKTFIEMWLWITSNVESPKKQGKLITEGIDHHDDFQRWVIHLQS
jgi:hypothetical protein